MHVRLRLRRRWKWFVAYDILINIAFSTLRKMLYVVKDSTDNYPSRSPITTAKSLKSLTARHNPCTDLFSVPHPTTPPLYSPTENRALIIPTHDIALIEQVISLAGEGIVSTPTF
jgi:hypothetical protein